MMYSTSETFKYLCGILEFQLYPFPTRMCAQRAYGSLAVLNTSTGEEQFGTKLKSRCCVQGILALSW